MTAARTRLPSLLLSTGKERRASYIWKQWMCRVRVLWLYLLNICAGALHEHIQELEARAQAARRQDAVTAAVQQRLEQELAESQVRFPC